MRADRRLAILLGVLTVPVLAGCIADEPSATVPFEVYEYRYPGDDVFVAGHPYGFLARVHNPNEAPITVQVEGRGAVAEWGPLLADDGWATDAPDARWEVAPAGALLFLFQAIDDTRALEPLGFSVRADNGASATYERNVTLQPTRISVAPGDHVQTSTAGLWLNGTSFYTNIQGLNDDPDFPLGYDKAEFDGTDLPVYVYGEDNTEQPNASRDRCFFTTIRGYNELLKTQAVHSTNARFLFPEEGYTRPGAEDHFLYGDALVFINTVTTHSGTTTETDQAPDPRGACFDAERYADQVSPVPIDLPPIAPV